MEKKKTLSRKSTLTRESLAKALKREMGISVKNSALIIDQIIDILTSSISQRTEVRIRLFGSFYITSKSERMGRNPKTMIEAKISARDVVRFKVAPTFRKRINQNIHLVD